MTKLHREKSFSKNYHTMLRGINKQDIFIDTQDKIKFEKEMRRAKEKHQFLLYSYAIMPNHVHIEMKDVNDKISQIMHHIALEYAKYFNKKYERVGHVFEGRYLSKAVESETYLINLMRYIHQNPQKAGIARMEKYRWSSYHNYVSCDYDEELVDKNIILDMLSKDRKEAIKKFKEFNQQVIIPSTSKEILQYEISKRLTDEELIYVIQNSLKIYNIQEIQNYNKKYRDELIKKLKGIKGVTVEQLSRVLGISKKVLQRALKLEKDYK